MKVNLIKRYSWSKTRLREFDDDASKCYMETLESGSKLIFDKEEISEILSKGLRKYLDYWADGDGDECGSSSCGIIYICDENFNIIYDINNEPLCRGDSADSAYDEKCNVNRYERDMMVFCTKIENKLREMEGD